MKEKLFYFYLLKFRLNSVILQNLSYKYLTLFKLKIGPPARGEKNNCILLILILLYSN